MTTFTTQRHFSASPSAIFNAIQDPACIARWWGPAGFTNTIDLFEFKIGGRWHLKMIAPDGTTYPNELTFTAIEANRQVTIEHTNHPHFQLSLTLEAQDNGTLLHWRQTFADAQVAQAMESIVKVANEQNLDRLGVELSSAL